MREHEPQTADSETSAPPGSDWEDVPEGAEYTPEQAARKFLALPWEQQVKRMERLLDDAGTAIACRMLNHEGAHIFATHHTCHDRYQEGFEAGKQALADHMEKLADEMFGPEEGRHGG